MVIKIGAGHYANKDYSVSKNVAKERDASVCKRKDYEDYLKGKGKFKD